MLGRDFWILLADGFFFFPLEPEICDFCEVGCIMAEALSQVPSWCAASGSW